MADENEALQYARLRWRCRRGMLELDELLQRYLQRYYGEAGIAERAAFATLVEMQDPQLLALVIGQETAADPHLAHVIARLTDAGN